VHPPPVHVLDDLAGLPQRPDLVTGHPETLSMPHQTRWRSGCGPRTLACRPDIGADATGCRPPARLARLSRCRSWRGGRRPAWTRGSRAGAGRC
jgi:hypothetical protein